MTIETPDMEGFGMRIKELRKLHRMSLDDVANAAGMTKSHIWELEQGRSRNPTVRAVWAIAGALGVSPSFMMGISIGEPAIDPIAHKVAQMIRAEIAKMQVESQ